MLARGVLIALLVVAAAGCARSGEIPASSTFRQAVAQAEARLFAMPYAQSSSRARVRTAEALAGLVDGAWEVAGQTDQLYAPAFGVNRTVAGRPGLFNRDNRYMNILLEPAGSYRISGRRGTHCHLTLQLLDAYPLIALGKNLLVLGDTELQVKAGDSFELYLGGPQRTGRWWAMPAGARTILVRETFADWGNETPTELIVERLDQPASQEPSSSPGRFARAAAYLEQITALWTDTYLKQLQQLPFNSLPAPRDSRDGLQGQQSVMGRFRLTPDQALVITVRASDAAYQAIQLGDPWFVTPDWIRHQCSLNARQARIDADGFIRFVVSLRDPGVPNWLDPDDNADGYIFMRWQGLKGTLTAGDAPRAEAVPLSAVRQHLPPDTPVIDHTARQAQLALRGLAPVLR